MLTVFNIQRYSLHDGEGIRTNIFFKGCPLRCQWCNNPEGLEFAPSIMFDERLCRMFGDCTDIDNDKMLFQNGKLVINRDRITDAGVYRNICPSKAIIVAGQEKSVSQILQEIEKDVPLIVESDHHKIQNVLLNLIGNSIKNTSEGFIKINVRMMKNEDLDVFID